NATITQTTANLGLSKVGAGTLVLGGAAPNNFGATTGTGTATTVINDGTLALAKAGGMTALLTNLQVGDNTGAGTDTLMLQSSEQTVYGGAAGVPAVSPSIQSTGQLVTTAAMSASTTGEVQAIVFTNTTAGNAYTINAGGPIATAVTALVT